jgi:hypothetical protein
MVGVFYKAKNLTNFPFRIRKAAMSKINFYDKVAFQIRKHPWLVELMKKAAHKVSPETVAVLDYPINSKQRWCTDHPHQKLYDIINDNRKIYETNLQSFLQYSRFFTGISEQPPAKSSFIEPHWINGMMPALDGVAIYGFMVTHKPNIYMEIGSGNSTKFARKAIIDHDLDTKIVSIDPTPRADIDEICDEIIRKPLEDADLQIFDSLNSDDILYIDSSHRVFMNSDATTIFLDILPRLNSGILVEIHDVTLPYDYPSDWIDRYYSEQYLLAAYLLAKGSMFNIILPNTFISHDRELSSILDPLWEKEEMRNVQKYGCSFWMTME